MRISGKICVCAEVVNRSRAEECGIRFSYIFDALAVGQGADMCKREEDGQEVSVAEAS